MGNDETTISGLTGLSAAFNGLRDAAIAAAGAFRVLNVRIEMELVAAEARLTDEQRRRYHHLRGDGIHALEAMDLAEKWPISIPPR